MSAFREVIDLPSATTLPTDPFDAATAVVALFEQSDIDLDAHDDAIVQCNGRFFMVIYGAGRDLVEVSSFAAEPPAVRDALSIEYYMTEARLHATGVKPRKRRPLMTERPGFGARARRLAIGGTIVFWVAIAITIIGALASDDSMERCQLTSSFDTCFTALNR